MLLEAAADTVIEIDPLRQVYWVKGRGGGWLTVQVHRSIPFTCSCSEFLKSRGYSVGDCRHVKLAERYRSGS